MLKALIVDDSATARYALRQLLARHQCHVDMVESAEEALDFLDGSRPDLIFMDHMMPGMDGFQAVKAIKATPAIADIPIVMYTSTQDGVYFGQARALGAADVILKPATAADVAGVLERLEQHGQLGARGADELSLDETATVAPIKEALLPPEPLAATTASGSGHRFAWMVLVALLLLLGAALLRIAAERNQLAERNRGAIAAIEWALNQQAEFGYGEAPYGGPRAQQLRELLGQLQALGFRGVVRIESHVGEFCTVRDERRGGWMVAPASLPLIECRLGYQSQREALSASERQTASFRRFLHGSPELRAGVIRIELAAFGAREPQFEYPADPDVSAGAWNRIAQRNQRLVYRLTPDN